MSVKNHDCLSCDSARKPMYPDDLLPSLPQRARSGFMGEAEQRSSYAKDGG